MRKIVYQDPGQIYSRLLAEFGIPPSGVVLELNPVLSQLRAALNPLGQDHGGGSRVAFLEGFPHEGKGAQAYFLARDWLRLNQAGVKDRNAVVLVEGEEDLHELAETQQPEQTFVLVRRAEQLPPRHEALPLLARLLAKQRPCALLVLVEAGLVSNSGQGLRLLQEELAETASQWGETAYWMEMEGIPLERLEPHLKGRCRVAGLEVEAEVIRELIEAVRIEALSSRAEAPRVLLGLLHRALDEAAQERPQPSPVERLNAGLSAYVDRQFAEADAEWQPRLHRLVALLASLASLSPFLSAGVPQALLDRFLATLGEPGLQEFSLRFPNLLRLADSEAIFCIPGVVARFNGQDLRPQLTQAEDILLQEVCDGSLRPGTLMSYSAGLGTLDRLVAASGSFSTEEAWQLGEFLAWQENDRRPRMEAIPPEARAGYLLLRLREGQAWEDAPWSRDAEVWGKVLARAVESEMAADALAEAALDFLGDTVSEEWWIAALRAAASAGELQPVVIKLWLDLYRDWRGRLTSDGDLPPKFEEEPAAGEWLLAELSLLAQLSDRLAATGLTDAAEEIAEEILSPLNAGELIQALSRSCVLPSRRWPWLREAIGRRLPCCWPRIHLRHVDMLYDEDWWPFYADWLLDELESCALKDPPAEVWRIVEVFGWLGDLEFPPLTEARRRLAERQEAWRARDPVRSFLGEEVLLPRSFEVTASVMSELQPALEALVPAARAAATAQLLRAALLEQCGEPAQAEEEAARADSLLAMLGTPIEPSALLARLREEKRDESRRRRAPEEEPEGLAGELLRQGRQLARANRDLEATRYFRAARSQQPDSLPVSLEMAALYDRLGKHESAAEILHAALAQTGESYELAERLADHYALTDEPTKRLPWLAKLSERTVWEPDIHREHLAAAVATAARVERFADVQSLAFSFARHYGYDQNIFLELIKALRKTGIPGLESPVPFVRLLLETFPPPDPTERISLLLALRDFEALRSELSALLRDLGSKVSYRTLERLIRQLPEGADRFRLEVVLYLHYGNLTAANTSLEELRQFAERCNDVDVFSAAVHLKFADEYAKRGMLVQAEHHLDTAFQAHIQALWNGYTGPEMTHLAAEIVCLRLISGQRQISREEAESARELLHASQFEQPDKLSLRELEVRLQIALLRSELLAGGIARLPAVVAQHEAAFVLQIQSLPASQRWSAAAFRSQLSIVHNVVSLLEGWFSKSEPQPELEAMLEGLAQRFLDGAPWSFDSRLLRAETLLRLAEGLGLTGAGAVRVIELAQEAKELLEEASETKASSAFTSGGEEDRVRMGIKLKRAQVLILDYERL